jgi:hypothetical protein
MSIIDPTAPVQEVQNIMLKIKQQNLDLYRTIDELHRAIFAMVWHDKTYSAKQIVDAFKTDGKDLFVFSGAIQQLLGGVNPKYKPCIPPKKYTINDDGTVTVEE